MDTSWSYDSRNKFDADKEISQVFSSALDDISQLTDDLDNHNENDDNEDDDFSIDDEKFTRNLESRRKSTLKYHDLNGNKFLPASTPLHSRVLKSQPNQHLHRASSHHQTPSKYSFEDSYEDARSRISPKVSGSQSRVHHHQSQQKENIKVDSTSPHQHHHAPAGAAGSLLMENDKLSRNLLSLNDKCSTMSTNYETLQEKFHQLYNVNETNLDLIEKLQAKVRSLESRVKDEQHSKESAIRRADILESSVNSLEYQLQEYSHSDFFSKTTESHHKVVEALKQKYDRELNSIRKEVDSLREKLQEKDEEIALQTSINEKTSSDQMKRMVEITKASLQKEMEREIQSVREKCKAELMHSFDRSITKLKEDWQIKLLEDVNKIILWLDDSVHEADMDPKPAPNDEIHFTALQELCGYLNSYLKERENRINIQITEFRKTKKLLEEALLDTQMAGCSVSSSDNGSSDKNVVAELDAIKEENMRISQKLYKYKECYKALVHKHQTEIESLKEEFKQRINLFRTNNDPTRS